MTEDTAKQADGVLHNTLGYAKVGLFATVYYAVLVFIYGSIVTGLPETFPLRPTPGLSPMAPEIVVPALLLFLVATGIAIEAHATTPEVSPNA